MKHMLSIQIAPKLQDSDAAQQLRQQFSADTADMIPEAEDSLILRLDESGLSLLSEDQKLQGDFTRLLPRLKPNNLAGELLVRAAKIKGAEAPTAIDATAGLGEDSFLLAASGFRVKLYERNPVIFALLRDALQRASQIPELALIAARMELFHQDSITAMEQAGEAPDVILLDPMFPERQKSALVKKKLQMIQKLEIPCANEASLLLAAMSAGPKKLIVKRPPKGPWLAELKPDHSITGKAVRFDCFVSPRDRLEKFRQILR